MPKPPNTPGRGNPRRPTAEIPKCPFEHIADPDLEDRQIDEIADLLVKLLEKRYPLPADQRKFLSEHYPETIRVLRGVHPKSHGCVEAVFEIDPNLSTEFQVGLFDKPGKQYKSIIRFSNAASLLGPDIDNTGKHGSRGMAIKVFSVGGKVLSDDHGAHNQDFLMINQPNFAFANTEDYLRLHRILDTQNDKADGFFAPLRLKDPTLSDAVKQQILKYIEAEKIEEDDIQRILASFKIVQSLQSTPVANPLGIPYFSAAPFLFGPDRVMKFSAQPRVQIPATKVPQPPPDNYLRASLNDSLKQREPIIFDFMVQVRKEVPQEEIENASTVWDEKDFPFVKVATITIPAPQDVDNTKAIAQCELLAFTPWHSLPEHQPIGSINRLRKAVYDASADHRLAR
ncbi:MAG: catalase family protein [Gammaproteobacteria bacterium]